MPIEPGLSASDLLSLAIHFAMLSLLGVGGAITTAPDMQRYVVLDKGWITDAQFSASIAIAQAAPGPNVLFVAAIGWNVAGGWGALATLVGCVLPSSVLTLAIARWGDQRRDAFGLRAFKLGMAPLTLGLLVATGWVLVEPYLRDSSQRFGAIGLVLVSVGVMLRSNISPLWLVALGALVGLLGGI